MWPLHRSLLGDNLNDKLDIKMCPDGSGQLYVPGLTEFSVESVEDINKVRRSLEKLSKGRRPKRCPLRN